MDQGVLDSMKKRYKCKLLAYIIIENESSNLSVDILRKVTMKDVVYSVAWDEASNDSLRRLGEICCQKPEHMKLLELLPQAKSNAVKS